MTLDMNYIRNEFAAKITANDGDKGSMDAALFHVVRIAFEHGRAAGGGDKVRELERELELFRAATPQALHERIAEIMIEAKALKGE